MYSEFYSEIYDTKTQRIKTRPKSGFAHCDECKRFSGHEVTCSKVTVEHVAELLKHSRQTEELMRGIAARWLEQLQRCTGKLAILKHENNKLRKANERLRAAAQEEGNTTDA